MRGIDLSKFALQSMQLYGRFEGIDAGAAQFGPDLQKQLDGADVNEVIFDECGYPGHERGVTSAPGLVLPRSVMDVHPGSVRFSDVARDAAFLRERIVALMGWVRRVSA